MVSDARSQQFTTVLSADRTVIHVAETGHLSLEPDDRLTLCSRPVVRQVSAEAFHRHGCPQCAAEAVRNGVVSIADRRQATVNLPRFLAARQAPDAAAGEASLPGQRGAVES